MIQESHEKARRIWVLVLTSLASCMVALDALVVATALTTIRQDLHVSITSLEWTVNAYTLSFAVLLIMAAALGDRFGRRRVFVIGLGLFTIASVGCALSPSIGWLIAARAVQGVGAAVMAPLSLTLLTEAYPPDLRGGAMGIYAGLTGLALLVGPVLGGAIAQGIAWQWIFWLNVPIGLASVILVLWRMEENFGSRTAFDFGGLLSVSGAVLGLSWGLVRGNSAGWGSFEVVSTLVAGAILAIVFIVWELRAREPMVPMHFFRSHAFSAGNTANFLLNASVIGSAFFIAQFFQTGQGYGPLGAGLRLLPWTATLFVVAPLAGALVNRLGERFLIICGLFLDAIGMGWIGLIASPGRPYFEFVAPLIIAGCGISMVLPAVQNVVVNAVAPEEIGKASGTFNMVRQLGAAFGVAILAAVFASVGGFGSAQIFSNGFALAMGGSALLAILGAISGLVLPGKRDMAFAPAQVGNFEREEREPADVPQHTQSL